MDTISASASVKDGILTLTMANLSLTEHVTVALSSLDGKMKGQGKLRILHHDDPMTCNTFEDPCAVIPAENDIRIEEDSCITLPPASVTALTLKMES